MAIDQDADADGGASANNYVSNIDAPLTILANAHSLAEGEEEIESTATAIAVEQEAENGDLSRNDVLNDGLISAFASAEAYAVEDGDAYAQATGVYQSADAWGANANTPPQSINYVTNAGTIQAAAYATVGGLPDDGDEVEVQPPALALAVEPAWVRPVPLLAADDGDGTAYATGIYQNAEDAVTGTNQVL